MPYVYKVYNIGDMFTMTHGSEFYRGIICEIHKDIEDEYVIYWAYPNQIMNSVGYKKKNTHITILNGRVAQNVVIKRARFSIGLMKRNLSTIRW